MPSKTPANPSVGHKAKPTKAPMQPCGRRINSDRPAGYHVGGRRFATLTEVLDPATPTSSLAELSEEQRADLVIARLQLLPDDFQIAMIGPGLIDKTRAIAEVRERTRTGRTLMEIEYTTILNQTRGSEK